jgi:hypothetical protein
MSSSSISKPLRFMIDYPSIDAYASSRYRKLSIMKWLLAHQQLIYDELTPQVIIASKGNDYRDLRDVVIIRDICDFHLEGFAKIERYIDIIKNDQVFIFSSLTLMRLYQEKFPEVFTQKKSLVIDDPFLSEINAPKRRPPSKYLKLGWFGNGFNASLIDWDSLRSKIQLFSKKFQSLEIEFLIFSDPKFFLGFEDYWREISVECKVVTYKSTSANDFLRSIDVAILPVDQISLYSKGKSHNRVLECIASGIPCIAYGPDEYLKFSPFCFISRKIDVALESIVSGDDYLIDILKGQIFIRRQFSPRTTAFKWLDAMQQAQSEHLSSVGRCSNPIKAHKLVRLNLGSGAVNINGYINIDFSKEREGESPDICCDIKSLPFPDDSVDEILSVHVIEHFH